MRNIIDAQQYTFSVKNRIQESSRQMDKCHVSTIEMLDSLFSSDPVYSKYKLSKTIISTQLDNHSEINRSAYLNDVVSALSEKYSNILIDNKTFEKEYRGSFFVDSIEYKYRTQYIKEMLKREAPNVGLENLKCLDSNITDSLKEHYSRHYPSIHLDITAQKINDIKMYPSHADYLKCSEERANLKQM